MPYDDDNLNEFAGYFEAKEPGRRERADAWATGIGLQAVDGLKPSKFLIETARRHIEGNTRTIAVFAIKYLRALGYTVTNNMFKDNSWYFRNALVRANYMGRGKNAGRTSAYLIAFFRNLLLGENNELKSRYLLVGCDHEPPRFDMSLTVQSSNGGQKKVVRKGGQKNGGKNRALNTAERMLCLMKEKPTVSQREICESLAINRSALQKHIAKMKAASRLRRVGPDKGGRWEVV